LEINADNNTELCAWKGEDGQPYGEPFLVQSSSLISLQESFLEEPAPAHSSSSSLPLSVATTEQPISTSSSSKISKQASSDPPSHDPATREALTGLVFDIREHLKRRPMYGGETPAPYICFRIDRFNKDAFALLASHATLTDFSGKKIYVASPDELSPLFQPLITRLRECLVLSVSSVLEFSTFVYFISLFLRTILNHSVHHSRLELCLIPLSLSLTHTHFLFLFLSFPAWYSRIFEKSGGNTFVSGNIKFFLKEKFYLEYLPVSTGESSTPGIPELDFSSRLRTSGGLTLHVEFPIAAGETLFILFNLLFSMCSHSVLFSVASSQVACCMSWMAFIGLNYCDSLFELIRA
jgi:hypothetical protein